MPLIPEPPMPTKWTCWMLLNSGHLCEEQVGHAGRGIGMAQAPGGRAHPSQPLGIGDEGRNEAAEALTRRVLLLEDERRARGLHRARVGPLVIVRGGGEGDEEARSARRGELGAGGRAA